MRKYLLVLLLHVFLFASAKTPFDKEKINESLDNLPVIFRKNMGQWNERILFSGSAYNANVYFLKNSLSFGFSAEIESTDEEGHEEETYQNLVWNLHFVGGNSGAVLVPEGKQDSRANYITGKDASKHCLNVADYSLLKYKNIYDKIDLQYYASKSAGSLKYDYIIKPGGDMSRIKMACEGIKKLSINTNGELEITTAWGTLIEKKPYSYQRINGEQKEVKVNFQLINDTTFGFINTEDYDGRRELVIDPVTLQWSTFVGGSGATGVEGYLHDITTDNSGNVYGTGWYTSAFPTTAGVYDVTTNGVRDCFVFKLNPTATAYVYATYIGGNKNDIARAIEVNSSGEVFIAGNTFSTNFPTKAGSYDVNYNGGANDAFVLKLNASGTALIYSTFLGGALADFAHGLAVRNDEAYITGETLPGPGGAKLAIRF